RCHFPFKRKFKRSGRFLSFFIFVQLRRISFLAGQESEYPDGCFLNTYFNMNGLYPRSTYNCEALSYSRRIFSSLAPASSSSFNRSAVSANFSSRFVSNTVSSNSTFFVSTPADSYNSTAYGWFL